MKERNLGYFRDGLPLEVALDRNLSYNEVINKVSAQMELKNPNKCSTFAEGHSLVQSYEIGGKDWTIGEYV